MSKSIVGIVLMLTALSSCTFAQRCKFNVNGDWDLQQNNGILVKVSLTQKGTKVTGLASYVGRKQGHAHTETGDITGTFSLDGSKLYRLRMKIKWDYGETGIYTGWVDQGFIPGTGRSVDGKWWMRGDAYIEEDPHNSARMTAWKFVKNIPCLQ